MIRLIANDGILWQSTTTPCINTTHTMNIQVDIQINEASTLYFMRMSSPLEVFLAIVPGTDAERLKAVNS